ncbi:MAG: MAPEG family protein [Rhodobacter sp.]|nr:MAPEG family protein [Rhodobacter sp.]
MTPELTALALAGLLQAVQYVLMSVPANLELGTAKTLSPRDPHSFGKPLAEQVSPRTGRLIRALNNHFEALILFTLAVTVVTLSNQSTGFTAACAWVYLAARILYIPAYAMGLVPWRSLIWATGFLATMAMNVASLI